MKLKTIIDGREFIQPYECASKQDAREVCMALGLYMETDPIFDNGSWKVFCSYPKKAA